MLQEATDAALDGVVFGKAFDPGAQAAHSSDYQGNRDAGLRRPIERVDHVDVGECIELCPNRGRLSGLRMFYLRSDQLKELCFDADRRNRDLFKPHRTSITGDEIEEPSRVAAQRNIASKEGQVSVDFGRYGVIIASTKMNIGAQYHALAPRDQ